MAKHAAVQIPTTDNTGESYSDPETAQIIIDHIAELKRKTSLAEEQLHILQVEVT